MATITRQRIRFAGDSVRFDGPRDKLRTAMPVFWRGNDLQFEVAVFENDLLQDISNLTQLTLEIKALGSDGVPPDPTATALMSKSVDAVDMNNSLTLTQWNDGSTQHAIISFTGQESNIAAGENWLVLWATTNDVPGRIITLAAGRIKVLEDGAGLSTTPSPPQNTYYNPVQSDARFAQRVQNLSDLSDIPTARTNLGLAIGSDVQAFSDNLGDIAALTPTKGNLLVGDGTDWVEVGVGTNGQHLEADSVQASGVKWAAAGGGGGGLPVPDTTSIVEGSVDATKEIRIEVDGLTTAMTRVWTAPDQDIDLTPGNTFEAADAGLLSIAGLTTAADKMIYTTALDTYAVADLTAAGRALLDDANVAAQRITLGLQIGTDVQAYHAYLADLAGLTPAKGTVMIYNGTDWVAVGVGTNDDLLTADSAQASGVKWAAGGGGGDTLPIVDTTAVVKGSVDATKLVRIEADGITTGTHQGNHDARPGR